MVLQTKEATKGALEEIIREARLAQPSAPIPIVTESDETPTILESNIDGEAGVLQQDGFYKFVRLGKETRLPRSFDLVSYSKQCKVSLGWRRWLVGNRSMSSGKVAGGHRDCAVTSVYTRKTRTTPESQGLTL